MGARSRIVCIILFMANGIIDAKQSNVINDIFHHQGHPQQKDLELGKVVLYFKQSPQIAESPVNKNKKLHELILTLPDTTPSKKVTTAFTAEQKDERGLFYQVKLQQEPNAPQQMQLRIVYDPQRTMPEYALFDSVSQQKGLVIRFYNKPLLDRMRVQERQPLYVAAAKKPSCVIIDAGHGGDDHGARGCTACEKNITLAISKDIAQLLHQKGIKTLLTRETDSFVPLDVRTSYTNAQDACLFVSIHANASVKPAVSGIETYCLSEDLFSRHRLLDMQQYGTQTKELLRDTYQQSAELARAIHTRLVRESQAACVHGVCDRGIKHSVAQVLLGVCVPAVLVEVGFLSNAQEAQYLADARYCHAQACAISEGILSCL